MRGTLRRMGTHLAHVQVGDVVRAVALSDCQLRLVKIGNPLPKYRPELAYGIGEVEDPEQAPGRAFDKHGHRLRRLVRPGTTQKLPVDSGTADAPSIVPAAEAATTTASPGLSAGHNVKPRQPHQSRQTLRACAGCGFQFLGRTTQTRCPPCFAAKRKADGREYYRKRGKQMMDQRQRMIKAKGNT